jgi:hypothetical protein
MVSNQENAQTASCEGAHGVTQLHLCAYVECVAGLIEQQSLRFVYQRASDQRPLSFTRRHLRHWPRRKVRDP